MARTLALLGGSPLHPQPWPDWPVWDAREEEAVLRALRSGHWGRLTGPEAAAFENEFATFQECRYGVATPCGTTALKLALLALGIQAGDEVIVPPYTFVATVGAVIQCNAVPVFVDIHPDSYCLDPARVAQAITPKTRAIIAVHLGGMPADLDTLCGFGLPVIEDASHAHGSVYKGRKVGGIGAMGCFSFQASKNLNCGEGGIVLTNDETLYQKVRAESEWGVGSNGQILGSNFRMTELQAALLRAQLTRLPEQAARRDANGKTLDTLLAQAPGIRPLPRAALCCDVHGYHLYSFRYDEAVWELPRATFIRAMRAEGIPVDPGYTSPLYDWPVFAHKHFGPWDASRVGFAAPEVHRANCPVMERVSRHEGCWIKQSALLAEGDEVALIAEATHKIWNNRDLLADFQS